MAGLEVELYITRLARSEIRFEEVGQGEPGPAPEVEVFQRGYQFLSDVRLDGVGDTLEAIRDGLWEVGLPRGRSRTSGARGRSNSPLARWRGWRRRTQ